MADERELQERLNRGVELDEKAGELKNELQETTAAAMMDLQNFTKSTVSKINAMTEEGRQVLNNVKAESLNIARQGESSVVTHTH